VGSEQSDEDGEVGQEPATGSRVIQPLESRPEVIAARLYHLLEGRHATTLRPICERRSSVGRDRPAPHHEVQSRRREAEQAGPIVYDPKGRSRLGARRALTCRPRPVRWDVGYQNGFRSGRGAHWARL
jgi:hypothetical protein